MRKVLLFAAVTAIAFLYSCKTKVSDEIVPQITEDDLIELDGDLDDNFLSSWEYIVLDDKEIDAIVPGMYTNVMYDEGLYFVGGTENGGYIKVYDSDGHFKNNISRHGRARNEYTNFRQWTIDRNRNEVLIATNDEYAGPVLIKKFDYQGNYLGELETDSIGKGAMFNNLRKCLSDGTLLIQNGYIPFPIYDYLLIPQKGKVIHPFEMTGRHYALKGYSDEELESMLSAHSYDDYDICSESYNQLSDTTYTLRLFDNHIYRFSKDGSECVANLAFRPQMRKKDKKNFKIDSGPFGTLPGMIYDMKDYLYIWFYDSEDCVYEKSTSKVYVLNGHSKKQLLPDFYDCSFYGNDLIGCVYLDDIIRSNERMESNHYDHEFAPELEDFYRKLKNHGNAAIIIAHYDKMTQ